MKPQFQKTFAYFYECTLCLPFPLLILKSKLPNIVAMGLTMWINFKGSMNNKMMQLALERWKKYVNSREPAYKTKI